MSWVLTDEAWAAAGVFAWLSLFLTCHQIYKHLYHYTKPQFQKVRVPPASLPRPAASPAPLSNACGRGEGEGKAPPQRNQAEEGEGGEGRRERERRRATQRKNGF